MPPPPDPRIPPPPPEYPPEDCSHPAENPCSRNPGSPARQHDSTASDSPKHCRPTTIDDSAMLQSIPVKTFGPLACLLQNMHFNNANLCFLYKGLH